MNRAGRVVPIWSCVGAERGDSRQGGRVEGDAVAMGKLTTQSCLFWPQAWWIPL